MYPIHHRMGYNEDRVWATLHLDMFDSASGRSRHLLHAPFPRLTLKNTTLHCASIVSGETYSNRQDIVERLPGKIKLGKRWHRWRLA